MKLPSRSKGTLSDALDGIHSLYRGRSMAVGSVTLTQNVATTTVTHDSISEDAKPVLFPTTANAATEIGNGTMYVSAVVAGSFTITHANAATAGRTFYWVALGG